MTVVIREGHDHSGAVHKDHDHVVNKGITTQPKTVMPNAILENLWNLQLRSIISSSTKIA
ncbi:hypothetical protein MtrunA17_Chr2g0302831 [Medicago truncatula]|uniref:Uncharacterized protein n=1 Tax=Medicago truncatula TaxID=3880 RepID=A0A396JB56_MEDTR|nr:hypothetical protein MtrunA17_Chr2g0302831 [Medicago truncatula]